MILRIRNSRITKIVSIFVLFTFIAEPFLGSRQLYALTGGPSQPEMAGFTPVNTDNMVDLFSGDFHYTIPLLTVPGPNGGYPVNLNYNAGIGMEHEASWVGLGWNLNPGAINRQVRGIPDDFAGDEITKTYSQRNNNTFIFNAGIGGEIFGFDCVCTGKTVMLKLCSNTIPNTLSMRYFVLVAIMNPNVFSIP